MNPQSKWDNFGSESDQLCPIVFLQMKRVETRKETLAEVDLLNIKWHFTSNNLLFVLEEELVLSSNAKTHGFHIQLSKSLQKFRSIAKQGNSLQDHLTSDISFRLWSSQKPPQFWQRCFPRIRVTIRTAYCQPRKFAWALMSKLFIWSPSHRHDLLSMWPISISM